MHILGQVELGVGVSKGVWGVPHISFSLKVFALLGSELP